MAINSIKDSKISPPQLPANGETAKADKTEKSDKAEKTGRQASAANAYAKASTAPNVKEAANVQISAKAKEMSMAKKVVEDTPDVREDKIAKYKDLIAKGDYKPDPGKIADGIAREAMKDALASGADELY